MPMTGHRAVSFYRTMSVTVTSHWPVSVYLTVNIAITGDWPVGVKVSQLPMPVNVNLST